MHSAYQETGFETTIVRSDGTKFNEYGEKHYCKPQPMETVVRCFLECEENAVFQVRIVQRVEIMRKFESAQWSVKIVIDGVEQVDALCDRPTVPFLHDHVVTKGPEGTVHKGPITFAALETIDQSRLIIRDAKSLSNFGEIIIMLRPVEVIRRPVVVSGKISKNSIGVAGRASSNLSMGTKSTDPCVVQKPGAYTSEVKPLWCGTWVNFVFNYRHRAYLESIGVIKRPLQAAPSTASITGAEWNKEVEVNIARKPDARQACKASPRADIIEPNQNHQYAIRPAAETSWTSGVDDKLQARKPDTPPVVGLSANAWGYHGGARAQRPHVQPAGGIRPDPEPIQAGQDSVAVGQALSRLSVLPQPADISLGRGLAEAQDRKPDITGITGRSSTSMPKHPDLAEDSDSDDDSWKAQAAIIENIQRHYAEIERHQVAIKGLKRDLKGKGRADKRGRADEESGGGRVGYGKKIRAEGGPSIDLTEDSD